jgi:enediyne biosynthesis protein E4
MSKQRKITLLVVTGVLLVAGYFGYNHYFGKNNLHHANDEQQPLIADKPLLELLSADQTGIDFKNEIISTVDNNVLKNVNFYNGGGVCTADFNNDGLTDVYLVSNNGKNKLYMNQGNLKFTDNAEAAGVASADGFELGATVADVNADGFMDIFVFRAGPKTTTTRGCKLYINTPSKPGYFTEQAAVFGLQDKSLVSGAIFFDYDLDGDLDCYVLNYPENLSITYDLPLKQDANGNVSPDMTPKQPFDSDVLYRNDGFGPDLPGGIKTVKYTDVSKAAGVQNLGFGLSVSVGDLNFDGYPDVYVANDFIHPDNLYINTGKNSFQDKINSSFRHNTVFSMGADLSDFDNDGLLDILSLDMLPSSNYRQKASRTTNDLSRFMSIQQYGLIEPVTRNTLQRNNGNGTFSDLACLAGVYKTDWAWSCMLVDFDNDGLKDLHITNGYPKDVNSRDYLDYVLPESTKKTPISKMNFEEIQALLEKIPNYKTRNFFYKNKGDWQFEDVSGKWASVSPSWSCGSAWADLDNDGDLELVVNNLDEPAFVYKNLSREQQTGNYLQIKMEGNPINRFAYGASALIEYDGKRQYQELTPNKGAFSCSENLIHFGLGTISTIQKLTVRWPDGTFQTMANVPANQRLTLKQSDASGSIQSLVSPNTASTLFEDVSGQVKVDFKHTENVFHDFQKWQLNTWSITDLGPQLAVGDVNGDGLDDFFIGNAFEKPASIYIQNANGTFSATSQPVFDLSKNYEDNGAVFFDADRDNDLDLFVTSGGPDANSDLAWQSRLFMNNGSGQFTNETTARMPPLKDLAFRPVAYDYDRDGDKDLFIGGRILPNKWPMTPRSIVLENNLGAFTDVTEDVGGDFAACGMVTDLAWTDLDADGKDELVVTGEWMPVSVFKLENNRLKNVTAQFGLDNTNGIWQRLALADIDNDGDKDIICGNLGLNTRYKAPLYCYAKDFDDNGTLDPIVAIEEDKKQYPLLQREVLVKQMPSLKKRYLYSNDYAVATIDELWSLGESTKFECKELQTCWFENKQGKFIRHALPIQAQTSVVQGIIAKDFNGDNTIDLLLAGNKSGFEVETNSSDASNGILLLGDGKGQFRWMDNINTGFWASGEVRDLGILKTASNKPMVIVSNNNAKAQFYKLK